MKPNNNILIIIFLISAVKFGYTQIIPIETIVDAKKTTYSTSLYNQNILTFKNQSYDLKQKIQNEVKITDNINPLFIKECLNENTYTSLRSNKVIFVIEYVCDQNGNAFSCKLINYGNKVSLSSVEIECILTTAINNTFGFTNIPSDISNFYILINKSFKFR